MHHEKIYLHEGRKDVTLTAYVQDISREMPGSRSRGAVIICPGGAYLGCSDREGEPVAMAFAAMGYHAFVLRYSVYNEGNGLSYPDLTKPLPAKPHCIFPNPMYDIGKAMLLIRSRAEEWHVNVDNIGVCGFSAGGHNSAMYGVYWDKPIMTEHFGVDAAELKPAACIMGYPLTDYVLMKEDVQRATAAGNAAHAGLFRAANIAFCGEEMPPDELLHKISPARLIDENMPPSFLWFTAEDALVPVSQGTAMASGLAAAGTPFEVHIFEKGPHGLSLATEATAGNAEHIDKDAAKWVKLCEEWLKKHFCKK